MSSFVKIILLVGIIFGTSIQSIFKKAYNKRGYSSVFIFSAITVASAAIFFVASAKHPLNFSLDILPYALGFAAAYCCATIFGMLAINEGSLSLTSLATSYSLLIPTLWGLLFYNDTATHWFFIGLALLLISLVLINAKGGEIKITLKWAIFVLLAFLGNGICSTVQSGYAKTHAQGTSEFMIIALSAVFLVLLAAAFLTERGSLATSLKKNWYLMVLCGVANGAVNLFVILLSPNMNTSLMFPLISAGGIVLTSLVSIFIYKEKLSLLQYIGMVMGIGAIVFMNL